METEKETVETEKETETRPVTWVGSKLKPAAEYGGQNPGPQKAVNLKPGAHIRLFLLWRTLSVRILTDVNVRSDLRILLRRH